MTSAKTFADKKKSADNKNLLIEFDEKRTSDEKNLLTECADKNEIC